MRPARHHAAVTPDTPPKESAFADRSRQAFVLALQTARAEIEGLRELLPVCAWYGAVRDAAVVWRARERWLAPDGGSSVTHGICPDCAAKQN